MLEKGYKVIKLAQIFGTTRFSNLVLFLPSNISRAAYCGAITYIMMINII